jgi:hypothetical protein
MRFMGIAAALQGAWLYIPDDLKSRTSDKLASAITIGLLVLGLIGRILQLDESK